MMVVSIAVLIFTSPDAALGAMIKGAGGAVELCITMLAIYCVWMSVLQVMDKAGINRCITALFRPITRRLFKEEDEKTQEYISLNLSANLLGMGGAATPMGIKAIEGMQERVINQPLSEKLKSKASDNMILFTVINCTSIQLLPATIIGMRASFGSASPSDIIFPSIIATTASTIIGIILCKVLKKR